MTAYLCDDMPADELRRGFDEGVFAAAKLYPAGATTHSEFGVTSIARVGPVLEAMQEIGMPLLVHGEAPTRQSTCSTARPSSSTPRQAVAGGVPGAQGGDGAHQHRRGGGLPRRRHRGRLAATVTPQHLMFNRNAIFTGGIRPHQYCLPVLKRERHRLALAASRPRASSVFLGTDSAPHLRTLKEAACGCAGIFSAPVALESYLNGLRGRESARPLRGFRQSQRCAFLRLAAEPGHHHAVQAADGGSGPDRVADGGALRPFLGGSTLAWTLAGANGH